jgi:predicted enzyme related to lactoylglutathione lyase
MTDNGRGRSPVRTVMFFAADPAASCHWWAAQLAPGQDTHAEAGGYCWFDLDGVEVGFHPADPDRNPVGGSPVVYWHVTDFDTQRRRLLQAGCQPHRGPLDIEPGRRISQLIDPFGNIFGIDA